MHPNPREGYDGSEIGVASSANPEEKAQRTHWRQVARVVRAASIWSSRYGRLTAGGKRAMATYDQSSRLTVYVCDSARYQHMALSDVIVHRAHEAGLSGATVLRGVEGFGRSGDVHTTRILDVSDHLPVAIVIVDDESKLRDFVRSNDDCIHGRLVTLERLEVYNPVGGNEPQPAVIP
jgi:uncharacterized protein